MSSQGDRPAIVVVDEDERTRALVEANLRRRYERVAPAVGEGAAAIAQLLRYLGGRDSSGERTAVPMGAGSRQ